MCAKLPRFLASSLVSYKKDKDLFSGRLPFLNGGSFVLNQIYDSPPTKTPISDFALPQPIPQLVHAHSTNVTASLGQTALLNCRVRGIGNKTVSIFHHKSFIGVAQWS